MPLGKLTAEHGCLFGGGIPFLLHVRRKGVSMQCYSRRQIVKHMGLAAGCLLLSPLSGCSTNDRPIDSADNTASDKEQFDWLEATGTYTPSDAFKQKGLWFTFGNDYADGRESVAKDTSITAIFEFNGDGTVTCWNVYDETGSSVIRFRDLEGLSDKEVLSMAKEHWPISQGEFESKKQNVIDELSSSYEDLKAEAADNPDLNVENAYFSRFFEDLKSMSLPKEPEGKSYSLKVQTDDTGNNTEYEKVCLPTCGYPGVLSLSGGGAAAWGRKELWYSLLRADDDTKYESISNSYLSCYVNREVNLIESDTSDDVYSSTYQGFGGIVTRTGGSASFVLDEPTSDEVEAD